MWNQILCQTWHKRWWRPHMQFYVFASETMSNNGMLLLDIAHAHKHWYFFSFQTYLHWWYFMVIQRFVMMCWCAWFQITSSIWSYCSSTHISFSYPSFANFSGLFVKLITWPCAMDLSLWVYSNVIFYSIQYPLVLCIINWAFYLIGTFITWD